MNEEKQHLIFLEKFISKYYIKQPRVIRSFTYIIFVILLVYSIYRLVGGEFSVRGRILVSQSETVLRPAKNYDVQVGDKFFGTNSLGLYYLILNPMQYYKLVINGKIPLRINKDENIFPIQVVTFRRFSQELEDMILTAQFDSLSPTSSQTGSSWLDLFVNSALAAPNDPAGNRLFITSIQLNSDIRGVKEVNPSILIDGQNFKLLATQMMGMPAGSIPVVAGKTVAFEDNYFFNIPENRNSSSPIAIKVTAESGFFSKIFSSSYSEIFQLPTDQSLGEEYSLDGDRGSRLTVRLLSRYDIVLWQKRDLENLKNQLKNEFIRKGFRVVEKRSPLGYRAETNAIFSGESVPFTVLQDILRVLYNRGVAVKAIRHKRNLRSRNPYEIQIGGLASYYDAPRLSNQVINQLLQAGTEIEFEAVLTR